MIAEGVLNSGEFGNHKLLDDITGPLMEMEEMLAQQFSLPYGIFCRAMVT